MRKGDHAACMIRLLVSLMLLWIIAVPGPAQTISSTAGAQAEYVTAALIANTSAIQAGKPFKVGVKLTMQPGWHTYYKESGDAGMPTKIKWSFPDGFSVGALEWEKPKRFDDGGIVTYGYKDHTVIAATVTPPDKLSAGNQVNISAQVTWLSCKDLCVPGHTHVSLMLPVASPDSAVGPGSLDSFSQVGYSGGLPGGNILDENLHVVGTSGQEMNYLVYLALAFVGGLILNIMPCVLPVISIKVLSFVQQAGEDPRRVFQLGLTFSAGIIASFLALSGVVVAIKQAGQSVGWGFQFQYPGFVIAMSVIVLALALSLFGLYYVGVPAGGKVDQLAGREGFMGTFFKGVLATVLATPCTAPFLGTALGFAFAQPWWTILAVFFTIGLGMSFPYLVLTARPGWMRFLPKPGVWMENFKESMGFVLLATVVWLLYVLGKQVGVDGVILTLGYLLAVAFGAWLIGRFTNLSSTGSRKRTVWALAILIVVAAYFVFLTPVLNPPPGTTIPAGQGGPGPGGSGSPISWQPFSIDKLDDLLQSHKTVLLDFTAEWCLTCKANEQLVLNSPPVVQKLKALKVVAMRVDWTRQDPTITKLLNKFGRSGVPLYVIFPATRPTEPIVLPEVIDQQLVLQKLDEAGPSL